MLDCIRELRYVSQKMISVPQVPKISGKEQEKRKGSCRMYTMSDVPEYKEISDQWLVAENELTVYRDRCMKEGIKLFARYFRDLWD